MKDNNKKKIDLLISWIVIAIMILIPFGISCILCKILTLISPNIIFNIKSIALLFSIISTVMIATIMVISIRYKK